MAKVTHYRKLNRRNFLRFAGASGASLLLLNGCRRGKPPGPDATGSENAAATTSAVDAASNPATLSNGGTVKWAEFYSTLTEQERDLGIDAAATREWMSGVVKQFEGEHRGWNVELEPVPYAEIDRRWAIDFNANISHDLIFSTPQLMARHHKLGDCLDITALIAGLPRGDREDLGWSAAWQATQVNGRQLGIPVSLQTHALAANRALCRKAGVDPDRSPQSLDLLLDAARKLTSADGKTAGLAAYLGHGPECIEMVYAPLVWHFGGNLFNESKKSATLTDDAHLQAAQWLLDLIYTRKVTPMSAVSAGAPAMSVADALAQGQAGLALGFASPWNAALQRDGLLTGCLPPAAGCKADGVSILPWPTSGQAGYTTGRCLSIHGLCQQPEMAFKLLQLILRPENLRTYPDAGLPVRLSTWQTPAYKSSFYQAWLAVARKGRPMPATPYYPELISTLAAALAKILSRQSAAGDALQVAEDDWNSRYAGE